MKKIIPCIIAGILLAITAYSQAITSKITSISNVTCAQDSNGSAAVSANGGSPPYTYLWEPSGQTTDTAIGLFAAIQYTVTITDSASDTAYNYITLTATSNLGLSTSSSEVSCFGIADGTAIALPTGGTLPYQYLWQPIATTSSTASNLSAGTYTNTVTDALGCTVTAPASITQPAVLSATGVAAAGAIYASATGGTLPYTYSWTPPISTKSFATGLAPGTYTIIVNDSNFCTSSVVVTIDTSIINYSFANIGPCNPNYFTLGINASSRYPGIFNNCVIDLKYFGGKFVGDSNGGITVTQNTGLIAGSGNDYNALNLVNLSDSVVQISFGDTSATSPEGLLLDSTPKPLLTISFRVQNGCQPGIISFTNELSTVNTSYYTVAEKQFDSIMNTTVPVDSLYNPHTCDSLVNPYPCDPYTYWNNLTSSYETSYLTCYDTVPYTCYDTTVKYITTPDSIFTTYSHNFLYNSSGYYFGDFYAPNCGSAITGFNRNYINAGTNNKSASPDIALIPHNSSILIINGYGFGNTMDSVKVTNANDSGSMFKLDSMDILSWTDTKIKIKMPSYILADTFVYTNPYFDTRTPGTGPIIIYNSCGSADTAHVQINYNIKNNYQIPTHEKTRPDIIRYLDTINFYWRCDTSISNNPKAFACIRYAIREWNCWTGVNGKLGPSDTLATHPYYGASNISVGPSGIFTNTELMVTNQVFLNSCYDYSDSISYYNAANIQVNPAIHKWSYDTTGTQTSPDSNYFFDTFLHELGHAYGLGHINDSFSLMYWKQLPGLRVNILSMKRIYPGPATLLAGLDMVFTSYDNFIIPCPPDSSTESFNIYCNDYALSTPPVIKTPFTLNLYPNPINSGNLTIAYQLTKNSYIQFKITDCTGRVIVSLNSENHPPGEYEQQINIDNLAQGVYLFIADINEEYKTIKFIKI